MSHGPELEPDGAAVISLALLAVVVLLIVIVAYTSSRARNGADDIGAAATGRAVPFRHSDVRRWVQEGLLSEEQALAIDRYESTRNGEIAAPRLSPAIEALAYVGGAMLAVGAAMLIGRFWDDMNAAAHLAVVGIPAAATGVVGAIVGEAEPVAMRLRGFLWTLSAIGSGAFAGLFVFEVFDRTGEPVAFATATTAAVVSAAFWSLRDRPLQHVVTFVGLVVAIGVGIAWIDSTEPSAWIGLAFWSLGALWAVAAWRRWVPPAMIGFPLGVALTLIGSGVVGNRYDWLAPILGLVTAAGWTAIGIGVNEVLALAPGVIGIFVFLPWTLGRFFGESLGVPVIVMLSGALLLAVVVVLWRRRSEGAQIGDLWGGHLNDIAHH